MCIILVLITLTAYWNSLYVPFQFDDFHHIKKNPYIREINPSLYFSDTRAFSSLPGIRNYRPLLLLSHAFTYQFFEDDPRAYHAGNLILHTLNSLLLFFCIYLLLDSRILGFLTALFFSVHPINTEAVTYISSRSSVMATTFFLAAFLCFIYYRKKKFRGHLFLACSLVFYLASMLSKSIGITLLAVNIISDYLIFKKNSIKDYLIYLYYTATAAIYIVLRILVMEKAFSGNPPRSVYLNIINQFRALLEYIKIYFYPPLQSLVHGMEPSKSILDWKIIVSTLIIVSIFLLAFFLRKKMKILSYGILFYFICFSPTSSIIVLNRFIVEHRFYLPGIGIALILAYLIKRLLEKKPSSKTPVVITVLLLTALMVWCTYSRNRVWSSQEKLWKDALRKSPRTEGAYLALGQTYIHQEQYKKAKPIIKKALSLNPDHALGHSCLGIIEMRRDNYEEAIKHLKKTLKKDRTHISAYEGLGRALIATDQYTEGIKKAKKAIELRDYAIPADYHTIAIGYRGLENEDKAMLYLKKTLELDPDYRGAYLEKAEILQKRGSYRKAASALQKALNLKDTAETHNTLGICYAKWGKTQKARKEFKKAVNLDSENLDYLYNLGHSMELLGQKETALEIFKKIVSLSDEKEISNNSVKKARKKLSIYKNKQASP